MSRIVLPPVDGAFEWRPTPHGPALVCRDLEPYAPHLFTTRGWSLGQRSTAVEDAERWREVASALAVGAERLVRAHQVHGRHVIDAVPATDPETGDIIVTADPTLAIAVQAADCVPLLLADPKGGAVAAVHAGWRGMAARVPETAVAAMTTRFGTRPEDLIAALGPSIGRCCYEVGDDVREAFAAAGFTTASLDRWFSLRPAQWPANPSLARVSGAGRAGHWFFDGWLSVRAQLEAAGVRSARIFSPSLCTASHPDVLCSYRRDGAPAGRLAAAIRSRSAR